jgi:uncharacterized protein (DUF1810 family)
MKDIYNLQRFVEAQASSFESARAELRRGRKTGHWMWFIFPQIKGLGFSSMSQYYGIASLTEAKSYLDHPLLGPRLIECSQLVTQVKDSSLLEIFGTPDEMKFKSSMTLFAHAVPGSSIFLYALNKFCSGKFDPATLALL